MINLEFELNQLLNYALNKELISNYDLDFCQNRLLAYFGKNSFNFTKIEVNQINSIVNIMDNLVDYALQNGLVPENKQAERDLIDTEIIGLILPLPSQVIDKFNLLKSKNSVKTATDYFYDFSINSNYIRMDRIIKNIVWQVKTEFGELELTINLSKPEKDPKAIAMARQIPSSGYPKCLLCAENVGFSGNLNHPARQNLRTIPLELNQEEWFLQYSPYVYYNEHSIVFKKSHDPMKLTKETFIRLVDFVDQFPHYFIGSNADLPIVGGSLLSHDHFQGGNHTFPMARAAVVKRFLNKNYPEVNAAWIKWPLTLIRLSSTNKEQLVNAVNFIYEEWQLYSDEERNIYAMTLEGEEEVKHNTITPIARLNGDHYEIDVVLRNNLTTKEHPFGLFHPHEELHHIKKENIGLIEVMGLAVLPGRLATELAGITELLTSPVDHLSQIKEDHELYKHLDWLKSLRDKYGRIISKGEAEKVLKEEVGYKFNEVLLHCGLFKWDQNGEIGLLKFMNSMEFREV